MYIKTFNKKKESKKVGMKYDKRKRKMKMEWTQFVIFFIGVFGLFIWNRAESRTDIRHMDNKLESTRELVRAIHNEMKDFHGKLEKIEIEYRSRMEKQDAEFKAHLLYHHEKLGGK